MPRAVILEHDFPFLHWDLMLEVAHGLRTWRLLAQPRVPGRIPCESLPVHRVDYLDYTGPVSGGRGQVHPVWIGDYQRLPQSTEAFVVELRGAPWNARVEVEPSSGTGVATFLSID